MDMKILALISWILVMIGAINWLLVGLVNLNIVQAIFGTTILARLIYILIGLAGCYLIYRKIQRSRNLPT